MAQFYDEDMFTEVSTDGNDGIHDPFSDPVMNAMFVMTFFLSVLVWFEAIYKFLFRYDVPSSQWAGIDDEQSSHGSENTKSSSSYASSSVRYSLCLLRSVSSISFVQTR